jgi:hypothetical protein
VLVELKCIASISRVLLLGYTGASEYQSLICNSSAVLAREEEWEPPLGAPLGSATSCCPACWAAQVSSVDLPVLLLPGVPSVAQVPDSGAEPISAG